MHKGPNSRSKGPNSCSTAPDSRKPAQAPHKLVGPEPQQLAVQAVGAGEVPGQS